MFSQNLQKLTQLIITLLFLSILFSCDVNQNQASVEQNNSNRPVRIISLAPHISELTLSAGAKNNLVGMVSFPNAELDDFKEISIIGDAFKLDYETIINLKPDFALSWKGGTSQFIVDKLRDLQINVIEIEINQLSDISAAISMIASLAKTEEIGQTSAQKFDQRLKQLKNQTVKNNKSPRSVFIETYHQPLYTVSGQHWMSEAATICGYENIFSDVETLSFTVTIESIITENPETIIVLSEQKDSNWQKWPSIEAVKNNQIIEINPDDFSRPSLSILRGVEKLCNYNH